MTPDLMAQSIATKARKTIEAERTLEATWRSEIRAWKVVQVPLTGIAAGLALHYSGQGVVIAVLGAVALITLNLCVSLLAEVRRLNRRIDAALVLRSPQDEA